MSALPVVRPPHVRGSGPPKGAMGVVVPRFPDSPRVHLSHYACLREGIERLPSKMAAACLRVQGLVSATVCRTAGFVTPLKTPARSIHNSCRVWEELQTKSHPGKQIYEDVEYIPTKKAKNPMKSVGIAWAIGFPSGIILFLLTKREVDKNRLKQLKVRQKMKASNEGKYETERYRATSLVTEGPTETNVSLGR